MRKKKAISGSVLSDPGDLWNAFVARAGLDLAHRKDGLPGLDHDLERSVRAALFLPDDQSLERALRQSSGITTTELLNAILCGMEPWSRMMRDILSMLNDAAAGADSDSVSIAIQWNGMRSELRDTLAACVAKS